MALEVADPSVVRLVECLGGHHDAQTGSGGAACRRDGQPNGDVIAVGVPDANVHRRSLVFGHRSTETEKKRADVVTVESLDQRLTEHRLRLLAEQVDDVVAESSYAHVEIE